MTTSKKRDLIEGRAALIVIDIQKSTFAPIPVSYTHLTLPTNREV